MNRRRFLKLLGLGIVGLAIRKFVPFRLPEGIAGGTALKHFQFRERNGRLVFYNGLGRKLFTLSSDGELVIG